MRHIIFYSTFNESLSTDSTLRFNVRSTTDGYQTLKNDDPSIPMGSEREADKLIITDPREFFNYQYGSQRDDETRSSIDSENILRIRIGGKDFTGRSGGVTHIFLRVPDNFDYSKFEREISSIRHKKTLKPDVERVLEEVENLVMSCLGESDFSKSSYQEEIDPDHSHTQRIIEFIEPIKGAIGNEKMKQILLDIASKL